MMTADASATSHSQQGRQVLRFAYFDTYEPLSFKSANGPMRGLLIKYVDLVCEAAGISAQHYGFPWARAQSAVQGGDMDALCTNPTASRREYMHFCQRPLLINRNGALHRKGDNRFRELRKKTDMTGFVLSDYIGNKWIEGELGGIVSFQWVRSQDQVHGMVTAGRSDAVVVSEIEGRHLVKKFDREMELEFTPLPFVGADHYTVGIRRSLDGGTSLVSRLDLATQNAQDDGRLAGVLEEYFG